MTQSVKRGESLGAQVAQVLRHRIVRGELAPGARITEEALAEEFSVSRGPVRDALTQLSFEKLVEVQRPRGVYIVGLTRDDVDQLYSLRGALEQLALSRAMRVDDEARWTAMAAAVGRMGEAADAGDHAAFVAADLEFHSQIYALADHPRLEGAWNQYLPTFTALLEVTINHDEDLHESSGDHVKLMDVMRSGTPTQAAKVLTEHLDGARERMLSEIAARA
ncbi:MULTISPECIES: GntR family transcriptional regulator [unclassified Microbacterium]|uniref:GntR family transcriptional regulator n=1 Tax=unclassified Microbacterium TaxID=2609290 RepID=UPI000CFAB914|nr:MULTISPECIES: GntR family transcriptional regulator [unclassified Microbacterium]PQZ60042.1 GntR family transcriptional regulator [Microbacterium sp. MYb43]PQZ79610.1 GntR family transcriptional regulator [Microbacterium sp. MYb40]PRB23085.1 GntR family transcriptional regulator [Microbacterium sp. MYb54]PRB27636.1 GntR family transcriptional regulator [Microbacterium sp. MYb50]PRB65926.1 GntR family transcriptional regulator [Microbacterium sp. MYb24]